MIKKTHQTLMLEEERGCQPRRHNKKEILNPF
jgi:hypothetical protein